ncbi:hypothetical protein [Hymenobacter metallilatus]|uniref:Uncharacterized protein n=1 Tax=Hymenobacter metallilatus TaxID=2493666 RepID=A0A428JD16_9BACT|nr:hypothetical protein [Hymenobacter metallilatus]RSK29856.1 hypothetical protein EI290_16095 [Hymenobacter metallilatus]
MSTTTKPKVAAKAKTPKLDLKTLQSQQLNGEDIEQAKGNQDDSYEFPAHEADRVHVKLTSKVNDPVKKEYTVVDKVVKLVPAQYERMERNNAFAEYDSQTILHDPRPQAAKKEAETDDTGTKQPMQPNATQPSLQDAQMRFQELYPEDKELTASKNYDELVELIRAKDADFGKVTE